MANIEGSITLNELTISEVDNDPTVNGLDLPVGSLCVLGNNQTGRFWIKIDSTPTGWSEISLTNHKNFTIYESDDFLGGATASALGWLYAFSGTGASSQFGTYGNDGTERAIGVIQIDTGTTSTGRAAIYRQLNIVNLGIARYVQIWRVALEQLSNASNTFYTAIGFQDSTSDIESTDGVYFRYTHTINNGAWQCVCRNNNVETLVDSSVLADTSYHVFKIDVSETPSTARFYIDNNLIATINTNVPTATNRKTGIVSKIVKSSGTTQVNLSIDYFNQVITYSNGR